MARRVLKQAFGIRNHRSAFRRPALLERRVGLESGRLRIAAAPVRGPRRALGEGASLVTREMAEDLDPVAGGSELACAAAGAVPYREHASGSDDSALQDGTAGTQEDRALWIVPDQLPPGVDESRLACPGRGGRFRTRAAVVTIDASTREGLPLYSP